LIEEHQVQDGRHLWKGRTRTNKLVFFPATRPQRDGLERGRLTGGGRGVVEVAAAPEARVGAIVPVRIERATAWSLQGALAADA
jgi:tRNA-2-methylthio-N6-dimethylallyladenosine synthase